MQQGRALSRARVPMRLGRLVLGVALVTLALAGRWWPGPESTGWLETAFAFEVAFLALVAGSVSLYSRWTNPGVIRELRENPDGEKAQRLADEYGITLYSDHQEMLDKEQLDLISICTWPKGHCEATVAAGSSLRRTGSRMRSSSRKLLMRRLIDSPPAMWPMARDALD